MKQLKEKREALAALRGELLTLSKAESLTDEQITRMAEINSDVEKLAGEIATLEATQRSLAAVPVVHTTGTGEAREQDKLSKRFSMIKTMTELSSRSAVSGLEKELADEAREQNMRAGLTASTTGVTLPAWLINRRAAKSEKRDITVSGGSGITEGGGNVATNVGGILNALESYMILSQLGVQMFDGLVGNLRFPANTTAPVATWEGEVDAAAESSQTWANRTLSAKRLGAFIDVSDQILLQSSNPLEAWVMDYLLRAGATSLERAAINGGGSNEPTGIIANTDVTVTFAGNAASNATNANGANQVYADWVNLYKQAMVNNATMQNLAYITSPQVHADAMIRPKQPSGVEGNFIVTQAGVSPLGFPVLASTNVPSTLTKGTSSDLSALIFGDFSQLALGSWGNPILEMDPYTQKVNGLNRFHFINFVDALVLQPKAFAVCKDIDATTPA
ncbi:MAG: phage major capsid protein [Bacteroidota bacterium]|jgi:HK97 family phage major capsid protein